MEDIKVLDCFCFLGEIGLMGEVDIYVIVLGQAMIRVIIQCRQSQDFLCKYYFKIELYIWICYIFLLNCICLILIFLGWIRMCFF